MTPPEDVSAILSGLLRFGIRPGLERVEAALSALDHPERSPRTFQIVGTNGKGSTAHLVDSILRQSGYRTGRFTSPHLSDIRERIAISGEILSPGVFSDLVREVAALNTSLHLGLTFFEFLTVMAHRAFRRAGVDCVVLEAGMGGRWDATTVSDPIVTVLTGVSLDHEEILGPGLLRILEEKVAVGRRGRPFVAVLADPELRSAFLDRGRRSGFLPILSGRDFEATWEGGDPARESGPSPDGKRLLRYQGRWGTRHFAPALTATYQSGNIAAAAAALEWSPLPISVSCFREGIARASHPGRFETVSHNPLVLLDGAHNPEAMERLLHALFDRVGSRMSVGWLFAVHADKDWKRMLDLVREAPVSSGAFFLPDASLGEAPAGGRWASARDMEGQVRGMWGELDPCIERGGREDLLEKALDWSRASPDRVLVVTGSLYLLGAIRPRFIPPSGPVLFSGNERDRPLSEDA